jgi:hypothetical protein
MPATDHHGTIFAGHRDPSPRSNGSPEGDAFVADWNRRVESSPFAKPEHELLESVYGPSSKMLTFDARPPLTQEQAFIRELERWAQSHAIQDGGCTVHCRFEVRLSEGLAPLDEGVTVRFRHNGRDGQFLLIKTVVMTADGPKHVSTHDVLLAARPWLRSLHRFGVGLGIK